MSGTPTSEPTSIGTSAAGIAFLYVFSMTSKASESTDFPVCLGTIVATASLNVSGGTSGTSAFATALRYVSFMTSKTSGSTLVPVCSGIFAATAFLNVSGVMSGTPTSEPTSVGTSAAGIAFLYVFSMTSKASESTDFPVCSGTIVATASLNVSGGTSGTSAFATALRYVS